MTNSVNMISSERLPHPDDFEVIQLDGTNDTTPKRAMIYEEPKLAAQFDGVKEKDILDIDLNDMDVRGDRRWTNDLCDLSCGECCEAAWCPCIVHGRIKYRLKYPNDPQLEGLDEWSNGNCIGYYLGACLTPIIPMIWGSTTRANIRKRLNIEGNLFKDCLASSYCHPCMMVQEERQIIEDRETLLAASPYAPQPSMPIYPVSKPSSKAVDTPPTKKQLKWDDDEREISAPNWRRESASKPSETKPSEARDSTRDSENITAAVKMLKKAAKRSPDGAAEISITEKHSGLIKTTTAIKETAIDPAYVLTEKDKDTDVKSLRSTKGSKPGTVMTPAVNVPEKDESAEST